MGFLKCNVLRIKQQNLLANDAFQNKLERNTVEALERSVKPGDEQEVMNSSDDTCSFPFWLCNELRNWARNCMRFCKVPSVMSLPSAIHIRLFVCGWKDKLNKVSCFCKIYMDDKGVGATFNEKMEMEKCFFSFFTLFPSGLNKIVEKLTYHWLSHHEGREACPPHVTHPHKSQWNLDGNLTPDGVCCPPLYY